MPETDPSPDKARLAAAEELRRSGNVAEARAAFAQVLRTRPNNVAANLGAGRCALAEGDVTAAAPHFTKAAEQGNYPFPLLELGVACRKSGHLAEAEHAYRGAAALAPEAVEPILGLAACARARGDRSAALALQRDACARVPDNAPAQLQLGKDLLKAQLLDDAAVAFQAALALRPRNPEALKAAAFIARKRGATGEAVDLLQRAAQSATQPRRGSAIRLKLAALQRTNGDLAAAAATLEPAFAADPDNADVAWNLAGDHRALGDRDRSNHYLRIARQLDPEAKRAPSRGAKRVMLTLAARDARDHPPGAPPASPDLAAATAARRAGALDDAEALYRRAAVQNPVAAEPLLGLAACARRRGDRAAALELQQSACKLAPGNRPARLQLGADLQKLGQLDDAASVFDSILAEAPSDPAALKAAAALARHLGDTHGAAALLTRTVADASIAVPVDPRIAAVWHRIGALERAAGHYDAAVVAFERAHEADPSNLDIVRALAREHRALGNHARCNALLDLAAEQDPDRNPGQPDPGSLTGFDALLQQADALRKAADWPQAEAIYRRAADLNPTAAQPLLGLAACARKQGDSAAALDLQMQACRLAPRDTAAVCQLAKDLQKASRLSEAATLLQGVLAHAPREPRALKAAAAIALEQGDQPAALRLYTRWSDADPRSDHPGSAAVWLQIGALERAAGHADAALAAFERARAADPANPTVARKLALQYRALGQHQRTKELAAGARLGGGSRSVARDAEQALASNDAERALALYRSGMQANPTRLSLYLGASTALLRLGRIAEAEAALDQAAERCRASPTLFTRRSLLLRDTGRIAEALALAQAGRAAFPDSFPVWEAVARLLIVGGAEAELRAWMNQAAPATDDERAAVAELEAGAAEALGYLPAALTGYKNAAALRPGDPALHAALARVHLARFETGAAAEQLRAQADAQLDGAGVAAKTYFDHVINEYRLEADVLSQIAALPADPASRAHSLLAIAQAHPQNTLAAVALTDALWRSGALTVAPAASPAEIPRGIAQYWEAPQPPDEIRQLMESWPAANSGFAYRRFDDKAARSFLSRTCSQDVLFAYHRAAVPSLKSDLFRLAYLAREGGVFIDPDHACNGSLDALLPPGAALVATRERLGMIDTGFVAALPEHPVIRLALEQAANFINRGDRDALRLSTGPGLLTRCLADVLAERGSRAGGVQIWSEWEARRAIVLHCAAAARAMAPYRSRVTQRGRRPAAPSTPSQAWDPAGA